MSEITVTLPKNQYDNMVQKVNEYEELNKLVKANIYFTKRNDHYTHIVYYKPTEPGEIESSLKEMFDEKIQIEIHRRSQAITDIKMLRSRVEEQDRVIVELKDKLKEKDSGVVKQNPTVSASCTTTMYIPKPPKKKSWWKRLKKTLKKTLKKLKKTLKRFLRWKD
jgi:hypothetical protein